MITKYTFGFVGHHQCNTEKFLDKVFICIEHTHTHIQNKNKNTKQKENQLKINQKKLKMTIHKS